MKSVSSLLLPVVMGGVFIAGAFSAPPSSPEPQPSKPLPNEASPRWFKGNLHTHSLWSDGNNFPEMIVDWYKKRGYDFLALSDHNTISQGRRWMSTIVVEKRASGQNAFETYRKRFGESWVETRTVSDDLQVRIKPFNEYRTLFEDSGRFLLLQAEEITDKSQGKDVHMNATNLVEFIKPQGGATVVEAMQNNLAAVEAQRLRHERPILIHLNHPNFNWSITAEELAMVLRERFFEVYNGHPGTRTRGDKTHVGLDRMWDIINTLRIAEMNGEPVYGLATDDSHQYFSTKREASTPGRGWVMVQAKHLTPESIIQSIEVGSFYASSGVTLRSVTYFDASNKLEIEIEPQGNANYTTQFIGTLKNYDSTHKPVLDLMGSPLPVTKEYSSDVGKVLATVEGTKASYELSGEELYVRAVITSSEPPEVPSMADQKAQAWTQPVGWKKWVVVRPLGPQKTEKNDR